VRRNSLVALALATVVATLPGHVRGAEAAADPIVQRTADVRGGGVRLTANLYSLASRQGKRLPTIIMSHGWGGTAASLQPQARAFATAGYFVVAFDYRGWGESDSRVVLTGPAPGAAPRRGPRFTAEVLEVREVVAPGAAEDIFNVITGRWAADGRPPSHRAVGNASQVVWSYIWPRIASEGAGQPGGLQDAIERFPPPAYVAGELRGPRGASTRRRERARSATCQALRSVKFLRLRRWTTWPVRRAARCCSSLRARRTVLEPGAPRAGLSTGR
jgi:hypothetical protein